MKLRYSLILDEDKALMFVLFYTLKIANRSMFTSSKSNYTIPPEV